MKGEKQIRRAFKITIVEYEDESIDYQIAEQGRWEKLEFAKLLQYVHERLIEDVEESMHRAVDQLKDDLDI